MSKRRKSTKPKFKKKGSKLSHAGMLAMRYGISTAKMNKVGVERFLGMTEDVRQLFVAWSKRGKPNGDIPKGFKIGGIKKLYPWRRSVEASVRRSGKATADWLELMARSPQWWEDRPEPKKQPPRLVDWPDIELPEEQGWRVERMVERAMRLRVA